MPSDTHFLSHFAGLSWVSKGLYRLRFSKKRTSMTLSSRLSSLVNFVGHVVLSRASKKMLWVVAMPVVACVAYLKSFWNFANVEFVRGSVKSSVLTIDFCGRVSPQFLTGLNPALIISRIGRSLELLFGGHSPTMPNDKISVLSSNPPMLFICHERFSSSATTSAFA